MRTLETIWRRALDMLFPKRERIVELEAADWPRLRGLLPRAGNELSALGIHPLFNYQHDKVRAIVWDIKYRRNPRLAEHIAELIHEEMLEVLADMALFDGGGAPLLLPIPMSKERRRERGFNQTEFLAKLVATRVGSDMLSYSPDILVKIRHTKPQAKLKRAERLENLKGAFEVMDPNLVKGKNIVLIDDVSTTGATISEAALALKRSGAREIIAFTIAH